MALFEDESRKLFLEKSVSFIGKVIEDIRNISRGLITNKLLGLSESIHSLIDDIKAVYPIDIKFIVKEVDEEQLDETMKLNIFRIIREQCTNIIKHSKAGNVNIVLQGSGRNIN